MPLFNVTVREHAYTGRFYDDIVTAESPEQALQLAAERPPCPSRRLIPAAARLTSCERSRIPRAVL